MVTKNDTKIALSEEMREYLKMLAELKEYTSQVDALTTKAITVVQNIKLPTKNSDVEMYNSSMVIHISTILNNLDKLRDDVKSSAQVLKGELIPAEKPKKVIPGRRNDGEGEMDMPEEIANHSSKGETQTELPTD